MTGADGTSEFEEIGHSVDSRYEALKYEIGVLEGHENTAVGAMAGKSAVKSKATLVRYF